MFAPKKLRHAAAVGVARNLLMGLQGHGWHLHASASRGQEAADADGAQAEVVRECAILLARLGCERSLSPEHADAVVVREWLQPCIADLCASLAQLEGRWAYNMCSQAGGDAARALLFAAEACHKRCATSALPLVDLLRAHLSSVSKEASRARHSTHARHHLPSHPHHLFQCHHPVCRCQRAWLYWLSRRRQIWRSWTWVSG
jgi:hypothetical protein